MVPNLTLQVFFLTVPRGGISRQRVPQVQSVKLKPTHTYPDFGVSPFFHASDITSQTKPEHLTALTTHHFIFRVLPSPTDTE